MATIAIEIPNGKKAEWVEGVLTLIDDKPQDTHVYKVGDKAVLNTDTSFRNGDGICLIAKGTEVEIIYASYPSSDIFDIKFENGISTVRGEDLTPIKPIEFKFKVGDTVRSTTDPQLVYTVTKQFVEDDNPFYELTDSWGKSSSAEEWLEICTEPKDITERIKTFEDACEWCTENGHHNIRREYDCIVTDSLILDEASKDLVAYLKLRIITRALNEGWKPTFEQGEKRWFVCADEVNTDEISICSADGVISYNESAMLLFKSSELAEYAATQFKDIFMDFCFKGKE